MNSLRDSLQARGLRGTLRILDSGGGVITPERCGRTAISILTSGPTGGVLASAKLARELGTPHVLTTDMGGTSFDVGMITDYEPVVSPRQEVNGYHILEPAVEITAIGAGGGSIAHVVDGQLFVGPESAGSVPGPACYQRGGSRPTVTDADVVLGIIDPEYFLGGTFPLDRDAAVDAIRTHVADPLGISVEDAAAGIKQIADHRMADLLDTLTVGKGHDPRDFVVFAYGGAGGTHCHRFGAELGVKAVIVPATATVHSAFGAVMSDLHIAIEQSDPMHSAHWDGAAEAFDAERMERNFRALEERAVAELLDSGATSENISLQRIASVRFRMQSKSLAVPVPEGPITTESLRVLFADFLAQFSETYGKEAVFTGAGVEVPSVRVQAIGKLAKPALTSVISAGTGAATETDGSSLPPRRIYMGHETGYVLANVVRGPSLSEGDVVEGPAVIEHPGTTIFISSGQQARIDYMGNTIIDTDYAGAPA